jgi:peptidoglycan/LPS O-acetylase OafA/YrhL
MKTEIINEHLKRNNLDLLRFFFAFQVVLIHLNQELGSDLMGFFADVVKYFPGVPAFFFLSGFLIYASYSRHQNPRQYFTNRFYRLYPGLLFVTLGGLGLAIFGSLKINGYIEESDVYIKWVLAQLSFGQGWNPNEFRMIGNGVINGVLWTITVELIFYCLVPIIIWIEKKIKHFVFYISVFSFAIFCSEDVIFNLFSIGQISFFKYLELTPIVWGWMFGLGILSFKYFSYLGVIFKNGYLLIFPILGLILLDADFDILLKTVGNRLGLIYFLLYSAFILYLGFGTRAFPIKNDLSYSLYIWHMLIINFLILVDLKSVMLALILTFSIAYFSWFYIEKPCLKLKKWSIRSASHD